MAPNPLLPMHPSRGANDSLVRQTIAEPISGLGAVATQLRAHSAANAVVLYGQPQPVLGVVQPPIVAPPPQIAGLPTGVGLAYDPVNGLRVTPGVAVTGVVVAGAAVIALWYFTRDRKAA